MVDWWSETEIAMIESLGSAGPTSPEELARRLGISEGETIAFVCMLAREKKISIRLVGAQDSPASGSPRAPARQLAHAGGH